MFRRCTPLAAVAFALATAPAAHAAFPTGPEWYKDPKVNATWTQASITEPDGTVLHADVLRPAGLPADAKTPVILSIGPYFGHSGQTGAAGAAEGTTYYPTVGQGAAGPSDRFADFVTEAKLMQRGYAYVMVDLRGFGGSTGCLDWGGPGEQADVKAAVEWAASQPWSTGSVGMYGKSYDGVTGLIGEGLQPKGLKAIVSQEPVYDLYNYLYTNGVRFENSLATPALYDGIAATPGVIGSDGLDYMSASVTTPDCLVTNWASQALDSDHTSAFWASRNYIKQSKGHAIPLILTQGFLENNTKPEGAWDYFNGLAGPKRGWFGMWDHIRGNDETEGDDAKPQPWFDEVMRWYDHYVRGVPLADAPVDKDPAVEVQDNDGRTHDETQWPPADSTGYTTVLKPGSYTDASTSGTGAGGLTDTPLSPVPGSGVWTISPPLSAEAQYSGVPHATVTASASLPNATIGIDTYDIGPDGKAILLSREASLVPADGKVSVDLYGNDWLIPAGHRIGVRVGPADSDWWTPTYTQQSVTVSGGSVTLPFLKYTRPVSRKVKTPARLASWLQSAPLTVPVDIAAATVATFALPPARVAAPASVVAAAPNPTVKPGAVLPRLAARIAAARHRVVVYGSAPSGAKVVVRLLRGSRTVARRTVIARYTAFRVTFRVRRAGRYAARVVAVAGSTHLRASTKRVSAR